MLEPKYDEDAVNLGYLKKVISDTEENIDDTYKNVSRHYASRPKPPYYQGDTWIDGDIVYTCINTRTIGLYQDTDWVTESGAKTEAERKNKTYLTQPSNYSAGDMWILQSDEDHRAGKKGEILISTAGRKEYDSDDWVNMLGYGTIKSINEVAGNLNNAINRIGSVEEAIQDGLIITFYQDTVPEGIHLGDLWYVTGEVEGYIKGKIYRYDGTNWIILNDPSIQEAFDEANEARLVADGKIQSFYSEAEPTQNMGVGDLWIDLSNNNQLYRYNGTNWVAVYDTRINELVTTVETVTERVTTIETDLGEIDLKVKETTTTITTIEGNIDNIETLANNAQSTADSAVEGVNNITNTQREAEGKSIHIEDSAEEPFVDVELYGESIQEGTPTSDNKVEIKNIEGRNRLIFEDVEETTINGVTYSIKNGVITLNGTAASSFSIFGKNFKLEKEGYYTLSRYYSGTYNKGSTGNGSVVIDNKIDEVYSIKVDYGFAYASISRTDNYNSGIYRGRIFVTKGNTYTNYKLTPQLEEGTVATPYIPYNSLEFKVEGKNRFDKSIYTNSAYNGYFLKNILKVGQNYTISFKNIENKIYGFLIKSMAGAATISDMFEKYSKTAVTFNYTQAMYDKGYTLFIISMSDYQPLSIDEINNMDIQIEEGSIATDYEPYKSKVVTFPLGEGEKLYQGSYLNDNGKNHTRKQVIFDGSEGWKDSYYDTYGFFYIALTDKAYGKTNLICSHFKTSEDETKYSDVINGRNNNTNICFYPNTSIATTLAEWKAYLAEQYANGTPVIVEYELAEPETVPYTEEQQEAWNNIKALMTYKNVTNITSTAYAKVTYMRDNGLDVYETKQNASKKYTETSEKLTEQKMTVDGVITQVSETNKRLTNDYLTAEQVNAELGTTKEDIEIIKQNQVTMTQTSKNLQIAIDTINNEGVSKVKTSMGYTFDDEGFKLNRSNAETGTIIDEAAVKVIDKTGASEQNLLYAGYVKEGNTNYPSYIGQTIVASANMIVQNYLVVPNSRFEEYTNPVLGGKGTGVFEV